MHVSWVMIVTYVSTISMKEIKRRTESGWLDELTANKGKNHCDACLKQLWVDPGGGLYCNTDACAKGAIEQDCGRCEQTFESLEHHDWCWRCRRNPNRMDISSEQES